MFGALNGRFTFYCPIYTLTMTTAAPITRDELIYNCSMWAIDNDPELCQELLEAYFSKQSDDDLKELHDRVYS